MGEAIIRHVFQSETSGDQEIVVIEKLAKKTGDTYTIPNPDQYNMIFCMSENIYSGGCHPCLWLGRLYKNAIISIAEYCKASSGRYVSGPAKITKCTNWTVTFSTPNVNTTEDTWMIFGIK